MDREVESKKKKSAASENAMKMDSTMNNQENQEHAELFYLKHFLERIQYDYSDIVRGEDPPDFYIIVQNNKVAVEITEYHSARSNPDGRPWRMVEEERERIRRILNEKVRLNEDLREIHVHIIPKGLLLPSRKEYEPFANEIIQHVTSKDGMLQSQVVSSQKFPPQFALLTKYVRRIRASKVNARMSWDISQAACVGISEGELINTIKPKLEKPRPSGVLKNWLLIVSGPRLSQSPGIHHHDYFSDFAQLNAMLKEGPFDQIYLYDYMLSRILAWNCGVGWKEIKGTIFANGEEVWDE